MGWRVEWPGELAMAWEGASVVEATALAAGLIDVSVRYGVISGLE